MRKLTFLAAMLLALASCSMASGQVFKFISMTGPEIALQPVAKPAMSKAENAAGVKTPPVAAKKKPATAPLYQVVGYDNCGRPILRQVGQAAATAKPVVNARPRVIPQRSAIVSPRPPAKPSIDTAFWDSLLADVEDPFESD